MVVWAITFRNPPTMIFGLEGGDAMAPYEYVPPVPVVEYNLGVVGDKDTPVQWLQKHSYSQPTWSLSAERLEAMAADKPKAAFIALVRNSEEAGMVHSILQVEARFNSRKMHRYDWIFFNDEPFSDSFKSAVSSATSSQVYFEQIKEEHWRIPEWIDESRFDVGREFQGGIGVGKAWLKSYHKMCRWNSGLFALEDRLKNYDWYWRVEPDVSRKALRIQVQDKQTKTNIWLTDLRLRFTTPAISITTSSASCATTRWHTVSTWPF